MVNISNVRVFTTAKNRFLYYLKQNIVNFLPEFRSSKYSYPDWKWVNTNTKLNRSVIYKYIYGKMIPISMSSIVSILKHNLADVGFQSQIQYHCGIVCSVRRQPIVWIWLGLFTFICKCLTSCICRTVVLRAYNT